MKHSCESAHERLALQQGLHSQPVTAHTCARASPPTMRLPGSRARIMIAVVAAAFWASSSYNISVYYAQGSTAFSPAKPRGGTTRRSAVAAAHIVQLVH